ncbi:MAG: cytidyltransferase [Ramlibacter sp.]|nr:cytidyltransferase [Ramlibacter sp.]
MSEAALQQIQSGHAGAQAALLRGELEAMHGHLVRTLDALADVTRAGLVARQERPPVPWDEARAEQLVWELLARLKGAGCHVFPYAGTLLGLERDGRLLPNDKDADLAVWLEDFALAGRLLQQTGLQRATDVPPFGNMATYVEPRTGYSVDLFGLRRDPVAGAIEGGVWLYGRPASWQRVLVLPWFDLSARSGPAGEVWWPEADRLLAAVYGDWRTPRPEWDSLVSSCALREVNLNWHCWALQHLAQAWLSGDLARTRRLFDQVLARAGGDARLQAWCAALDEALR